MIEIIDNIILLGTSHVGRKSVRQIKEIIDEYEPEVVGIELDLNRLKTLIVDNSRKNKKKSKNNSFNLIKELGISGYLFAIIAGFIQQKIGKSLGISPGIDMKSAYNYAREKSIPISLIDINIKVTLKKISSLDFFTKIKLFFNLFFKSFKKEYRNKLNFNIKDGVPDQEVIKLAMIIFKKEVPQLYDILIKDRNKFMVEKLLNLKKKHNGYILAVVGAGHVEGMKKILKERLNKIKNENNNQINFSFILDSENNYIIN